MRYCISLTSKIERQKNGIELRTLFFSKKTPATLKRGWQVRVEIDFFLNDAVQILCGEGVELRFLFRVTRFAE